MGAREARRFRLAAVQAAPVLLDREATTEKGVALIREAAEGGADLVGFPETWIPGYPYWIWLGSPAWGAQFVPRYHDESVDVDGTEIRRLARVARECSINVVMGISERSGGSLYMGQVLISRTGEVVTTRRKLKPTHVERSVFGEGDGSDLAVHDFDVGRVGALCCWEHLQPLSKYAMYSAGEEVHVASWPSLSHYRKLAYSLGPELNTAASQIYAAEGGCFVIASTAVVSQEMIDLLCDTPEKGELIQVGGGFSMIFGPDGSPMCTPLPEDAEGILYADADAAAIALAKSAADPAGHYARPDVVRLLLNREPAPCVERLSVPVGVAPVDGEDAESVAVDHHRASWRSITPQPLASSTPPGNEPENEPKGWR